MSDFHSFWRFYPRKQAKIDAEKAWKTMKCEDIADQVIAGLKRQLPHFTDPKFIPLPASWLRSGRWQDEHHIETRPEANKPPPEVHDPWKQPDPWRAMMNVWLVAIVRKAGGVDMERLRAMVAERNRLADQCREMWGPEVPADRDMDVLGGMLARLEGMR